VIERVTATGYASVIMDRIFMRPGMVSSGVLRRGQAVPGLVRGDGHLIAPDNWDFDVEAIDGAGSLYSTAADLLRFDRALASGTLLRPDTVQLMTAPHVPGEYGYGWMLGEQGGTPYSWHSGNLPGFGAYMARPARDEFVVVLSDRSAGDVRGLARQLLRQLRRSE
jgi:CubicO group peptidase (beta-lactamase class C family)